MARHRSAVVDLMCSKLTRLEASTGPNRTCLIRIGIHYLRLFWQENHHIRIPVRSSDGQALENFIFKNNASRHGLEEVAAVTIMTRALRSFQVDSECCITRPGEILGDLSKYNSLACVHNASPSWFASLNWPSEIRSTRTFDIRRDHNCSQNSPATAD